MGRSRRSRRFPKRVLKTKRLLLAVGVSLLVCGSTYGIHSVQSQRQADHMLAVARAARDEKDWAKATDFYTQYTTYRKRDVEVLAELAGVLEEVANTNPRRWAIAARAFENVLSADADRAADRHKVAIIYLRIGQYGTARKHLDTLLRTAGREYTDEPEIYELLAKCDLAERNTEAVKQDLRKAIATGKAATATHLDLFALLNADSNRDGDGESSRVMNELVTVRPKDLSARVARARFRLSRGDRAGAADDIRFAYAEIPGGNADPEVILKHADFLAQTDLAAAKAVLTTALKAAPDDIAFALGLAEVSIRGGANAEGIRMQREAAARLPDGDPQLVTIGDRLIDANDLESAAAIARRLDSQLAGRASGAYLTGRVAARRGEWPSAIPLLNTALPALAGRRDLLLKAHLALGDCSANANDPIHQGEHFGAALELDPNSRAAKLGRADALEKLNRGHEAANIYRELVKTYPDARLPWASMKLRELAAAPEDSAKAAEFEATLGPLDSLDPGLDVMYAQSLVLQNRPDQAEAVLLEAYDRYPTRAQVWIALAEFRSANDPEDAWMILEEAVRQFGDRLDLRLAKAQLLMMSSSPRAEADLVKLSEGANKFTPAECYTLWKGLGATLAARGNTIKALAMLQRAAEVQPYDLDVRFALFDLAHRFRMSDLADKAFGEIRRLDGDAGAVTMAAEFARDVSRTGWLTPEQIAWWKPRVADALKKRGDWGRVHTIAGDLASLDKRPAEALKHYLLAIERGDFTVAALRRVSDLMLERQRYRELANVLGRQEVRAILTPEMKRQYDLALACTTLDRATSLAVARGATAESRNYREQLARAEIFFLYGFYADALEALKKAKLLLGVVPNGRVEAATIKVRCNVLAAKFNAQMRNFGSGAVRR